MPSEEEDFIQIKECLLSLYTFIKANLEKDNINIEEENEREDDLENISIIELINFITTYVNYLIEIKNSNEDYEDKTLCKQYEELLIKAEDDIRKHIRIENQLKIKIEDLEFELDDYRTGKNKKKVRNLNCINDSNYNSNFNSSNRMTNQAKPISVNSNNNYLILKLKKEIESLKSQLSKQEMNKNNEKFKQIENKIIQKKLNDNLRINKNIINNNKNNISKDNFFSFANNTFTNNFYNLRDSKNKPINNNHSINQIKDININLKNYNKIIFNHNTMSANSFISNSKINLKNKTFRTKSNDKAKNNSKKIIYDKNKYIINSNRDFNFKKIYGKKNNFNKNIIEIKIKEENNFSNNNTKINNTRTYTLINNNINDTKNIFLRKKKIHKNKSTNLNLNVSNNNFYLTERKKTNLINTNTNTNSNNNMNLNSKERNTLYIPTCEFNLTWSKFPIPIRFTEISSNGQYKNNKNFIQKIIRHSTNFKPDFDKNINKKIISFKNKNINVKKDSTPQKITINRRKMENKQKNEKKSKLKGNNNSSMKNMKHINYTKPKINDEFCINNIKENLINLTDNNKMIKTQNNFYNKGDIYVRKKGNFAKINSYKIN